MLFNKAKEYEIKYDNKLENFDKFELLDYVVHELKGISKNSVAVKICCLKKYLIFVDNALSNLLDDNFIDTLIVKKRDYIKMDEIIDLCELHLINASDKALIMLLYNNIRGVKLEELRNLKVKDINLKLKTIVLPNRTIVIDNSYTLDVLKNTINEKYYHKYADDNIRSNSSYKYNPECEYLFKSLPNKRNNDGLNPYSFSALTNKLFRFSNMFNTTTSLIFQSGICNKIDEYEDKIDKKLTIREVNFYVKNILKLTDVSGTEIYNMLNQEHKKIEIESN